MMKFKQKDIAIVGVALLLAIMLSVLASKYLFSNSASQNTEVQVVPVIHTDFPAASSKYFNSQAIDPTQNINISPNNSQQPFNSSQ